MWNKINKPIVWSVIYFFVLIPFFAILYTINANEFYHSTIAQQGYLKLKKEHIEVIFSEVFKLEKKPQFDGHISIRDLNISFEQKELKLDFVISIIHCFEEENFDTVVCRTISPPYKINFENKSLSMSCEEYAISYNTPRRHFINLSSLYFNQQKAFETEHKEQKFENYFKMESFRDQENPYPYFLFIPNQFEKKLNDTFAQYCHAYQNKIPQESSSFITFLYFSVVTITTLGYGDILPLTNLARFLVALESVLGILVIGLFLASIGIRNNK